MSRQSSITVGVRVRPFTSEEENKLITRNSNSTFYADGQLRHNQEQQELELMRRKPNFIRKIVNVVDDKMLVFDPQETNPYTQMQRRSFPQMSKSSRIKDLKFVFDHLYDENSTQMQVFEGTTKPLLDSLLDGYNATVFAYGATGCGKTHTISGTMAEPGIIFLTMQELYRKIETLSDSRVFEVSISFLEIYNESIRDLLCPETSHKKLNLREDSQQRIVVSNLSVHKPQNVAQVMEMIVLGNQNRTCSATEANATSSRSHAVLQINVSSTSRSASLSQEHSFATLSIIDLAGSERAATTKNRGERLTEGANINKSLLALGNCINALCAGPGPGAGTGANANSRKRAPHVPYRDSKLTRLLKFSLGGNCKTVMIVCISPSSKHYDETLNALKYADRAKEIKTKVIRNQHNLDRHVGSYLKMITEQKQEIEELRAREAAVGVKARREAHSEISACVSAIMADISALRHTLERNSGTMWERVVILGKRKLMLMKLDELRLMQESLWRQSKQEEEMGRNEVPNASLGTKNTTLSRVSSLVEQVRQSLQRDIVALEQAYEAKNDVDESFARSTGASTRRLAELPGYDSHMAAVHSALASSVHESMEKEILVNSSVLLDYLIGELDEYKFGVGACVQALNDTSLHLVGEILSRMVTSEFSSAVDFAASTFVSKKQKVSERGVLEREVPQTGIGAESEGPEKGIGSSRDGLEKGIGFEKCDKRSSTSPLQQIPKRRGPRGDRINDRINDSFDDSIALKSDFEDDTPPFDHVNHSILETNELGFSPGLQSPPEPKRPYGQPYDGLAAGPRHRYVSASSAGHSRFGNEDEYEETPVNMQDDYDSLLRHPLLNKQASKIVTRD